MTITTRLLTLFLSLFCLLPNSFATVAVVKYSSGTPIQVCQPSDSDSNCGGGSTNVTINTTSPMTGAGTGTTFTLGVNQSGLSSDGYLSAGDFTTFSNKLSTVTADSPLSGSGTPGSHLIFTNPGYITNVGIGTQNTIAYWSTANSIGSLNTGTYPSLTELSYVKDVTSAIQTQLNGKQATGNYITALTGNDGTASGPGSVAFTLNSQWKGWIDGGTNVYTSTTTDSVGIGTTTPNAATLEIVKQSSVIPFKISSAAAGNGDYLSVTSSGNIGVGTYNPRSALDVLGSVPSNLGQVNIYSSANKQAALAFGPQNDSTKGWLTGRDYTNSSGINNFFIYDKNNGVPAIFIDTSDNVGIGNNAVPVATLEIDKVSSNPPFMITNGSTHGNFLVVTSAGKTGIGYATPGSLLTVGGGLTVGTSGSYVDANSTNGLLVQGNTGIGTTGPASLLEVGTRVFNVLSGGNIGIGSINPRATLDVQGNGLFSSTISASNFSGTSSNTNTGDQTCATTSGCVPSAITNVGIGTANTITYWDTTNSIGSLNTGTYPSLTELSYSKGVTSAIQTQLNNKISSQWATQNTTDVSLAGGNVGIGTTKTTTSALSILNGNVGVGTWKPTSLLQVVGTANATTLQQGGVGVVTTARQITIAGTANQITSSTGAQDMSADRTWTLSLPSQATPWIDGGTNVYQSTITDSVGIGTTTPAASTTLEIVKQSSNAPLKISSSATGAGNFFLVDSSGNVGIGTTKTTTGALSVMNGNVGIGTWSPVQALQINGTTQMTGFKMPTGASNGYVMKSDAVGLGSWQPASSSISIGGTITSGTAGSVLFVNPTATLAQNNDNFYWDNTNDFLGIGTITPVSPVEVFKSTQSVGNFAEMSTGEVIENGSSPQNYYGGDTLQYKIYAVYAVDGHTFYSNNYVDTGELDLATPGATSVDLDWTIAGVGAAVGIPPVGYLIVRNYNMGGYNDWYQTGTGLTLHDGNALAFWNIGSVPDTSVVTANQHIGVKLGRSGDVNYGVEANLPSVFSKTTIGLYTTIESDVQSEVITERSVSGDWFPWRLRNTATDGNVWFTLYSHYGGTDNYAFFGLRGTQAAFQSPSSDPFRVEAPGGVLGAAEMGALHSTDVYDSALTSGRIPLITTGGQLTDSSNLVFNGSNLGIGTALPGKTLDVNGDIRVRATNSIFLGDDNKASIQASATTTPDIKFLTNSSEIIRITNNGNVGIGTSKPVAKLAIVGNIGIGTIATDAYLTTTPPTGGMIVEGNVGIGSLSPGKLLDVAGTSRAQNIIDTGVTASTYGYFDTNKQLASATISTGLNNSSGTLSSNAVDHISYQPGLLTAVNSNIGVYYKASKASTVDNIIGSAVTFSCVSNPTITMYECGTSTTCTSSPVTIGTVTVTALATATVGTISNAAITAGDYIGFAFTAGTCASIDIAVNAQIHSN